MKRPCAFIDAHVHGFLQPSHRLHFRDTIAALTGSGLEKIVITALPFHDFSYELKLSLAPRHIRPVLSPDNCDETALLNAWMGAYGLEAIVQPFIDVRFVAGEISSVVGAPGIAGWTGIKAAYIPDDDRVLAIRGIPGALGISRERYLAIQHELFSYAQEHGLPLLYHVNLSEHFDWMCEVLASYPRLRLCIPHLGYSLRRIAGVLERFENTYTDPSYLIAVLGKNNPRYGSFIKTHYTRILLGSDAILAASSPVQEILSYANYFGTLAVGEDMRQRIMRLNALDFLSPAG